MKPSRTTRLLGNERVVTNQAILPDFAGTTATGMKSRVAKRARYWRSGHRDETELGVTRTVTPGTTTWSPGGQRFPTAAVGFGSRVRAILYRDLSWADCERGPAVTN